MMNLIYLHGFRSSSLSIKGQQLKHYCQAFPDIQVHLPDLNLPPYEVIKKIEGMIQCMDQVALVGSSLGGFYATQLVAKYQIPAVLINPAMRPWQLFRQLFSDQKLPYTICETWTLDELQLTEMEKIAKPIVQAAEKILVLLQQGDEVLDYREAHRYYNQPAHPSLIFTDAHGNHAMEDFENKLPLVLAFLTYSLK